MTDDLSRMNLSLVKRTVLGISLHQHALIIGISIGKL